MDKLIFNLNKLNLDDNITYIIKIQSWYRGCIFRLKHLPLIMYQIKKYLSNYRIKFSSINNDGRINSCIDEENIIKLLKNKYNNKMKIPNIRMWYDILIYDYLYGWIPINIKTTTTKSADNIGNMALCVYSYTNYELNLEKTYNNGIMSEILYKKIKNKEYNHKSKKDYYFLVFNKNNNEIIINSIKGLNHLTSNINNLPFQIKWKDNKNYTYSNINNRIKLFINTIKKPKSNWKQEFINNINTINL